MNKCAKIEGMGKPDLGRIHAQKRQNHAKQFQIGNDPQKGGYYNELSESEK
jgi:hypothetical protein